MSRRIDRDAEPGLPPKTIGKESNFSDTMRLQGFLSVLGLGLPEG